MAMLVETYEQTEIDADNEPECEAEALDLIERLGLEGQQNLLRKNEDGETTRCPYRKMTADEAFIYGKLLPKVTTLKKYCDAPIPVRVLQVAAHASELFDEIDVWSAANADIKDPLLVGIRKTGQYDRERFILARWGEVLLPLSELRTMAGEIFRGELINKASEAASKAKAALERFTEMTVEQVMASKPTVPSYYD